MTNFNAKHAKGSRKGTQRITPLRSFRRTLRPLRFNLIALIAPIRVLTQPRELWVHVAKSNPARECERITDSTWASRNFNAKDAKEFAKERKEGFCG
jgi:hypothetical protein